MRRRDFITIVGGVACTSVAPAIAQPQRIPVVGFLSTGGPGPAAALLAAFREALAEAGFVEGRTVIIDYRWAEGDYERLKPLAEELVRRNAAVIAATGGTVAGKAARAATQRVPILFIAGFDPKHEGLVDSINRPGTNATGVSVYTAELGPKRLELLLSVVHGGPLAMLTNPNAVSTNAELEDARRFARLKKVELIELSAATIQEIEVKFEEAANRGAKAIFVSADSFFTNERVRIVNLATRYRMPACYPWPQYVQAGGLMSYGPNLIWAYRQIGSYAARILKGEKPSELPVVFPTRYEMIINLKAAKDLGISLPQDLLISADHLIE